MAQTASEELTQGANSSALTPQVICYAIHRDDVRKVGSLARLALADDEIERLTHQLNDLLTQFARLQELPLDDVPPTSHAVPVQALLREDEITPSLPRERVLQLTPHVDEYLSGFLVPQVISE